MSIKKSDPVSQNTKNKQELNSYASYNDFHNALVVLLDNAELKTDAKITRIIGLINCSKNISFSNQEIVKVIELIENKIGVDYINFVLHVAIETEGKQIRAGNHYNQPINRIGRILSRYVSEKVSELPIGPTLKSLVNIENNYNQVMNWINYDNGQDPLNNGVILRFNLFCAFLYFNNWRVESENFILKALSAVYKVKFNKKSGKRLFKKLLLSRNPRSNLNDLNYILGSAVEINNTLSDKIIKMQLEIDTYKDDISLQERENQQLTHNLSMATEAYELLDISNQEMTRKISKLNDLLQYEKNINVSKLVSSRKTLVEHLEHDIMMEIDEIEDLYPFLEQDNKDILNRRVERIKKILKSI